MTPLTGPDESGHDGQRNAGLTAAERQAMRERHDTCVAMQRCSCTFGAACETSRLLDALDATEKERDEARRAGIEECIDWLDDRDDSLALAMGDALLPQPDAPAVAACGTREDGVTCILGWRHDGDHEGPRGERWARAAATAEEAGYAEYADESLAIAEETFEVVKEAWELTDPPTPAATAEHDHDWFATSDGGAVCINGDCQAVRDVAPATTAETCDRWHVTQTILHDPARPDVQGNCLQALVASMLGVPLDAVPHFTQTAADTGSDWLADLVQWLSSHGWDLRYVPASELKQAGTYIETGPSARGVQHCVLYRHGETWDPHPSRAGLLSVSMRYSVSRSSDTSRATIAGFCGECGLAAGSDGCAHGDGAA